MKTLAVLCAAIVALAAGLTLPAMGQTPTPTPPSQGTVDATISTELIAIQLSEDTLDYGTLDAGALDQRPNPLGFDVDNVGTVPVDVGIRGDNTTTTGTPWVLAGTPGQDQYVHRASMSSSISSPVTLTTSAQQIHTNILVDTDVRSIFFSLDMPTGISTFGQHIAPIIVTATKHTP
jgi:hypothetical protein